MPLTKQVKEYMMSKEMDGYMKDSQGRLIPVEMVSAIDRFWNEVVSEIVAKALAMRDTLTKLKVGIRKELTSYLSLSPSGMGRSTEARKAT